MTINVTQVSGGGQGTPVYQPFPFGVQFYITDGAGNPSEGVEVNLQINAGPSGATGYFNTGDPNVQYIALYSGPDGFTNIAGMYANGVEGTYDVSIYLWISYAGPTQFSLENTAPSGVAEPTNIECTGGSGQTVAPNTALPTSVQATVTDQYGAPSVGVNVTATAPASGASGVFASTGTNTKTVATNGSGVADFGTFTTNATEGAFYINLTSGSLSPGKALVTIKAPTAEVCTPASKFVTAYGSGADWNDAPRWATGAAQSSNLAYIRVNGTITPAQTLVAYDFDQSQLALIDDQARITSMTIQFSHRTSKGATYFPSAFRCAMALNDRGIITSYDPCSNGMADSWATNTKQWTTFTNTGQPGNLLYGAQLKALNLRAFLEFTGETSSNTGGDYDTNGLSLIVCYINPAVSSEQAQSLQLCIL